METGEMMTIHESMLNSCEDWRYFA
jgi:hypothetical protein